MGKGSKKRYQKNPKEQIAQLKKNKDELEKLYAIEEDLSDEHEQRIKDLEEQNELIEKKLKHLLIYLNPCLVCICLEVGSNHRLKDFQSFALPTELSKLKKLIC